ncbi:MAG TPA: RidA family protein, partial [Chitinophagaceae bacterium]
MSAVEKKLEALGLKLEPAKPPVGNYIGSKSVGELLYASGRVSNLIGEIGSEVSLERAKHAAMETVLLILAIVKNDIRDLDLLTGVVKLQGFLRCSPGFTELP